MSDNFFTTPISVEDVFEKGYCTTQLSPSIANMLLKQLKRETFVEIQPDAEGLDISGEKYYKGRFMAARSLLRPNDLRPIYKLFSEEFNKWAHEIMKQYESAEKFNLAAYCGTENYEMEIHTDVGDRSIFDVIAFLGHDFETENDGGVLEVYRMPIGVDYDTYRDCIGKVIPKHGTVVVLNNLNPTLSHLVTPVKKPSARRYQLIGNYGMIDPPCWEYEFNDIGGFALPGEVFTFSDHKRLIQSLENKLPIKIITGE